MGTALFGTVVAVTALCATAIFGASLSHLTTTPTLYGQDYQIVFSSLNTNPTKQLAQVEHDHAVNGIMVGTRDEISIDGVSVFAAIGQAVRGPLLISTVDGHAPSGDGEIALGDTTLHQVGAHIGSIVHARFQVPTGGSRVASFRVVGTASFPSDFGLGGLGSGAAFTTGGYLHALCPPGPTQTSCLRAFHANEQFVVAVHMAPGAAGRNDVAHYLHADPNVAHLPTTPTSLINFGEAVNFPLILGFVLALFGAATLVHLLVVSVARRRREIGLMKALGFVRVAGWCHGVLAGEHGCHGGNRCRHPPGRCRRSSGVAGLCDEPRRRSRHHGTDRGDGSTGGRSARGGQSAGRRAGHGGSKVEDGSATPPHRVNRHIHSN